MAHSETGRRKVNSIFMSFKCFAAEACSSMAEVVHVWPPSMAMAFRVSLYL